MRPLRATCRRFGVAALFATIIAAPTVGAAQSKTAATLTVTTVGMTPADEAMSVDISRWSTDAERDQALAAFAKDGGKTWAATLQTMPAVGYIWPKGDGVGYAVRYAHRTAEANGSERIVLVTDRALGSFEREPWKANAPASVEYPFSVIELRIGRTGPGEGKASLAAAVAVDATAKTIALENYSAAPVLFKVTRGTAAAAAPVRRAAPAAWPAAPAATAKPAPAPAGK